MTNIFPGYFTKERNVLDTTHSLSVVVALMHSSDSKTLYLHI